MGPASSAHEVAELGIAESDEPLYACLRVPAMGDAKVSDLAQLAHQFLLRKKGVLPDTRWMQYGHPVPVEHIREGSTSTTARWLLSSGRAQRRRTKIRWRRSWLARKLLTQRRGL